MPQEKLTYWSVFFTINNQRVKTRTYQMATVNMTDQPNKQKRKRQETEAKLLKAFEKVLKRDGFQKLGVNAIVKEAGLGKGLIYDYFGGLDGLADAWAKKAHFVPEVKEIAGGSLEDFKDKPLHEQIGDIHKNYATYLKNNPMAIELYADELQKTSSFSKGATHLRNQIGKTHEKFFTDITPISNQDDVALIFILQAASNYLALRAKRSPNFNGIMINKDEGWQQLMAMIDTVAKKHFDNKDTDNH